ncbi:NAD(P)H-hydrate dehydratase [Tepidibacillus fermentans]|uniref:Bifunctional NAD(P)H-hydrate repair enzyme n=1 Tax=Tepidibacillus fermentans TaxID=1281767 RepID=A0A4R3K6D6_9BACI|nr:NAD(P)H-hydrate dehydratase [Tepidibacillus fermentans]TCS78355.1 NAD(P)H-hydrate epimerase [Tepidibacillus fermentans]
MLLVTAEEMREMDRKTIEEIGIPSSVLMENAGVHVARKIKERVSDSAKVLVLAGHGNNGGDGFVTARHLGNAGYDVVTWIIGNLDKSTVETRMHYLALVKSQYPVNFYNEELKKTLFKTMEQADVIVDALLGTGAKGGLREPIAGIIQYANQTKAFKVAVDMPSGVDSNTGEIINQAFLADLTVTFALPKIGQFIYPGANFVGELEVADISIPPVVSTSLGIKRYLITEEWLKDKLPIRKANSHKGTYGHALLIGGSKGMPGAPTLATMAALRSGAGLTTVVVPKSIQAMVFSHVPEAICIGSNETSTGHLDFSTLAPLITNSQKYTALGIGPGMGVWDHGLTELRKVITSYSGPLVIDADGLNLLSKNPRLLLERNGVTVITPHPGEMARLIGKDIQYVEQNRLQVAHEFAKTYQVYLVLKGAHSIIATPQGELYLNTTGGPELAKGGTGDVLTGMLTGFLAQRLPVLHAVLLAVYLHGVAGTLASKPSNYSTLARDLVEQIGYAIQQIVESR